ncbi:MAG TPA: hypothetical protein VFT50_01835 [Baekduia sp.]|nr:hypothetical protein [Baekduia sp.]
MPPSVAADPDPAIAFDLPTSAVAAVQSDIVSHFALFRAAPSPIPWDIAAGIASSSRFGRNAALARAIRTPYGKGWVIPGDGYLCITMPDPVDGYGESCQPTSVVLHRGLWLRLAGDGPNAQAADVLLIPDGATATKAARGTSMDAETGVVSHLGIVSDPPPTVAAG